MNNDFVPQMKKMLANKNLFIADLDLETDWVNTSYVGLWIENPDWKYFAIAIEFERRWLKDPIIGFHRKEEYKCEDIAYWLKNTVNGNRKTKIGYFDLSNHMIGIHQKQLIKL